MNQVRLSETRGRPVAVGEELDDRERLRRGVEEGSEVGGVEVHGRVAVGRARAGATDAERPERVRPARRRAEEGGEDDEEARRRRRHRRHRGGHGSRRARISRLPGRDLVIRSGHLPPSVESSRLD